MEKARAGRTTIIVAHRLSTVRHADKIFVISDGTVVEEGNHDQLMSINGVYAKMLIGQEKLENGVEEVSSSSVSQTGDEILVAEEPSPECPGRSECGVISCNLMSRLRHAGRHQDSRHPHHPLRAGLP